MDTTLLSALLHDSHVMVFDTLVTQLDELLKSRHPQERWSRFALDAAIQAHIGSNDQTNYGVWVYYPWSRRLVHTLPEAEFIEVRTNRNHYKISPTEQCTLAGKRVGVIGLSVGQAVAVAVAMERSCGELRLADFDLLELSNLNRVRTGLHQLGTAKVVAAAREIAELDPFLPVTCFLEGITEENIDRFLSEGGKLDLLIEECDSLDIKLLARSQAKRRGIPVLMNTSDRGMLDVERFDREPQRPLLHGLIAHLETDKLKNLTSEEKIPYILAMLGIETVSPRLKASMIEVEQTINTWPQLATGVTLGGALVGDVARRILLDQFHDSGRYFVDLDNLIKDKVDIQAPASSVPVPETSRPLTRQEMIALAKANPVNAEGKPLRLDQSTLTTLVEAATLAPSGGNNQPWQWLYGAGHLYLFHDPAKSSFLDFDHRATYLALGAATENLVLQAHTQHLQVKLHCLIAPQQPLVAAFSFYPANRAVPTAEAHDCDALVNAIPLRQTNRTLGSRQPIRPLLLQALQQSAQTVTGAQVTFLETAAALTEFAEIAAAVERLRLFNRQGHADFVQEIRWTPAEAQATGDGIDLATIDLTQAEQAGLAVAKAWPVVAAVKAWGGGGAFAKLMHKTIDAAACVGLLTMPTPRLSDFFAGGRALQRVWLTATQQQLAFQPVASATFLFARLLHGQGAGLDESASAELHTLRQRFVKLFPIVQEQQGEILLFRLALADAPQVRSLRYPVAQVLTFAEDEELQLTQERENHADREF